MSISQYVSMPTIKVFRGILLLSFLMTIGTYAKAQQRTIPPGIPVKGIISFPQAPEGNILLFDLRLKSGRISTSGKRFNAEFRLN